MLQVFNGVMEALTRVFIALYPLVDCLSYQNLLLKGVPPFQ